MQVISIGKPLAKAYLDFFILRFANLLDAFKGLCRLANHLV